MVETLAKSAKDLSEVFKEIKEYVPSFLRESKLPDKGTENIYLPVARKNSDGFTEYQKEFMKEEYGLSEKSIASYSNWEDFERNGLSESERKETEIQNAPEKGEGDDTAVEAETEQSDDSPRPESKIDGEIGEKNELSQEEINEKQKAAIKDALERLARGEQLTEQEKGNLCEMMMDQFYISKGWMPLHSPRVTALDDKGHHGIDGVYQKGDQYIICDAKYDTAQLKDTQDGRQMSENWIDSRLDQCVGKEKADEIREEMEDGAVSCEIYHYDPNPDESGNTYSDIHTVDENGNSNRDKQVVECYNDSGERTDTNSGGENGA